MTTNGEQLEALVSFVEKALLPEGFQVTTNKRLHDATGSPVAEFDIEARGKLGSTHIAWLIECRDRPSEGPAPACWIEQLVGRRIRFGFNKVTAVSTTGFARGAAEFAHGQGIELREVTALSPEQFSSWIKIPHLRHITVFKALKHATLIASSDETEERKRAFRDAITASSGDAPLLKNSRTGDLATSTNAFSFAVGRAPRLFSDVAVNGPVKSVRLSVIYSNPDDHFVVETSEGDVRVQAIIFYGQLALREEHLPLELSAEYRHVPGGEPISQLAIFAAAEVDATSFRVEMHNLSESGETRIVLRRLKDHA